jgi:hypothetical protein
MGYQFVMNPIRILWAFVLFAVTTAGAATVPLAGPRDSFLLVHLRWVSNQVTVVKSERVAGRLKPQPSVEGALQVRLADVQGNALWVSALEDPRRQRFEFPDESQPGGIRQIEKWLPTGEVLVRVPFKPSASEFQLLGAIPNPPLAAPQVGSQLGAGPAGQRPVLVRLSLLPATTAPPRGP